MFKVKYRLFHYKAISFRLINAPANFQRLVNNILGELLFKCIVAYLDNILIYLDTFEEYIRDMKKVLRKIRITKLLLKLRKYKFYI